VPLVIIILIYIRIVFYIKTNSLATNIRRNLFEQQRLFRLIIIPILILFLMYFPSVLLFVLIKIQVISMPIYTSRICLIFISLKLLNNATGYHRLYLSIQIFYY